MKLSRKLRIALLAGVLLCTVGCDQASKHVARTVLSHDRPLTLSGGVVELQLADNPGSFLSAGAMLLYPARLVVLTLGVGLGLAALCGELFGALLALGRITLEAVSVPKAPRWEFILRKTLAARRLGVRIRLKSANV